ncbi:hypothetical protein WJX79_001221 [Trebouxia sp. C0005]|nr:MAG: peroxiredoxin- mitochondrial-like [Trebouxia sp. A1-2]
MAKVGASLPDIELQEGAPDKSVKITDLFKGKKGILFGVPGAFTPGCHKTHLKGYVTDYDKLTKAGAEVMVCVAVNDAFVMEAWGDVSGAKGKVHMLADSHGNLARALGVELDMEKMLGTKRCKRFSAVIDNNVIKSFNVEQDGTGLTCSLSNEIVSQLQKA